MHIVMHIMFVKKEEKVGWCSQLLDRHDEGCMDSALKSQLNWNQVAGSLWMILS